MNNAMIHALKMIKEYPGMTVSGLQNELSNLGYSCSEESLRRFLNNCVKIGLLDSEKEYNRKIYWFSQNVHSSDKCHTWNMTNVTGI